MTIAATLSIGVMLINAAEKDRKTETKSKAPVPVDAQNALCQKVSILIKNKTILKYQLDSVHVPDTPNTDSYLNIDIDGDDISDKIVRGCGTSECELVIELSSDGKIEFGNGHFFIIRFEGQLYLLSVETRDLNAPIQNPIFPFVYFYRFLSLGIPAAIFGTFIFIQIRLEWIELMLGIFIFCYSILKFYQYYMKKDEAELKNHLNTTSPLIIVGGFTYGLLTSLISAVGPLNVAMLEKTGHYKESFIENFGAIGFGLAVARTPFYFITNSFPYDFIIIFLLGFPIIYLGTKFGQKLTPKIPLKTFQIIVFYFLLIISLKSIITASFSIIVN